MMKKFCVFFLFFMLFFGITFAGRGCCSHHGGQWYCGNNGKRICYDGTTSPSCYCNGGSKTYSTKLVTKKDCSNHGGYSVYCSNVLLDGLDGIVGGPFKMCNDGTRSEIVCSFSDKKKSDAQIEKDRIEKEKKEKEEQEKKERELREKRIKERDNKQEEFNAKCVEKFGEGSMYTYLHLYSNGEGTGRTYEEKCYCGVVTFDEYIKQGNKCITLTEYGEKNNMNGLKYKTRKNNDGVRIIAGYCNEGYYTDDGITCIKKEWYNFFKSNSIIEFTVDNNL